MSLTPIVSRSEKARKSNYRIEISYSILLASEVIVYSIAALAIALRHYYSVMFNNAANYKSSIRKSIAVQRAHGES